MAAAIAAIHSKHKKQDLRSATHAHLPKHQSATPNDATLEDEKSSRPSQHDQSEQADETDPAPEHRAGGFWRYKVQAQEFYKHTYTEIFVAGLIVSNFVINMTEKSIDPDPKDRRYDVVWVIFEYFYNIAFTIELAVNMYAFWLREFWSSGWNKFDFLVVSIGLLNICKVPLPGPLKLLRMMRAFRVFRLFKRVKSLGKIMESLGKAIPGVLNAFVILVLVMCIYAILGVEFFRLYGEGGKFKNAQGNDQELVTARGLDFGWEYFGNFPKSLYTMFQVLTTESWSEAIARPLIMMDDPLEGTAYAFFFVSFVIVCGIILINVVVAVLLEKMVDDTPADGDAAEKEENESEEERREKRDAEGGAPEKPADMLRRCAQELTTAREDADKMKKQLAEILDILRPADVLRPPRDDSDVLKPPSESTPPTPTTLREGAHPVTASPRSPPESAPPSLPGPSLPGVTSGELR
jgi:hypothetical protein